MKKRRFFLLFIVMVILLTGCDSTERYPWHKAKQWYCKDIDFMLTCALDEKGDLLDAYNPHWIWNDEAYYVHIGFRDNYFDFMSVESDTRICRTLFAGTFQYQGENMILTITEDKLFDGAFDELVFVPQ